MSKQRYELEIEEILRRCEEEASRERVPTATYQRPVVETGARLAETTTLYKVEQTEEEEILPSKRHLTGGQRTALAWLAFIVGLVLYPYLPLVTLLLVLIPITLAVTALRETSRKRPGS
jgi:hypothetical protein